MKTAVTILAVLGALYAIVTVGGLQSRGGKPSADALAQMRASVERFVPTPSLRLSEIAGTCVQGGGVLVQGQQTCTLAVRRSDALVRRARLSISAGARANLTLTQPGQFTVRKSLGQSANRLELDIFENGGSLSIACLPGNPCRLAVE